MEKRLIEQHFIDLVIFLISDTIVMMDFYQLTNRLTHVSNQDPVEFDK